MTTYQANVEQYRGDSWLVELPSENWGFLHLEADGGRATLESAIHAVIEQLTGDKDFGVVLHER